jgi:CheY-like chemotaxis protein
MTYELERKMCKILIVEDSETFRKTLRGILYSRFPFFAFDEARDGKEALKKINSFRPDLIFMDIKLPGESGLELTKKIKESYYLNK